MYVCHHLKVNDVKRMKSHTMKEKFCKKDIFNKELLSKICKEVLKLDNKKTILYKNGPNILISHQRRYINVK